MLKLKSQPVTVIVPCYRQAHLLSACLHSVIAQTRLPEQIVVIDDGSDDDVWGVVQAYQPLVQYVRKSNGGLSSARNAGLAVANASHVLFLDADDLLEETSIEQLLETQRRVPDSIPVMGHRTFSGDPPLFSPPSFPVVSDNADDQIRQLFHNNIAPVHCFLAPVEAVKRVGGFSTALQSCEDWDLWLRLALEGVKYRPVDAAGALYRQHPDSMSKNYRRMCVSGTQVVLRAARYVLRRNYVCPWLPDLVRAVANAIIFYSRRPGEDRLCVRACNILLQLICRYSRSIWPGGYEDPAYQQFNFNLRTALYILSQRSASCSVARLQLALQLRSTQRLSSARQTVAVLTQTCTNWLQRPQQPPLHPNFAGANSSL